MCAVTEEARSEEAGAPVEARRPWIKRRWAILSKAGGGVAVIAVAGALAAGGPDPASTDGDSGAGGDTPELALDR
jgi:hypothetical protein